MTYRASPERFVVLRLVVRLVFSVGAIVALWLIAPTAANALEPPASLDDAVTATTDAVDSIDAEITVTDAAEELTDTVDAAATSIAEAVEEPTDTVNDAPDSAVTSVADSAEEPTDTVNDAPDSAVTSVIEAVEEPTDTVNDAADVGGRVDPITKAISSATRDVPGSARGASARVWEFAANAVPTVEDAGEGATDVARQLQDAASTVDPSIISPVEATAKFATADVATVPHIDVDGMAMLGRGEDVTSLPLEDEPALTIRGPPLTTEPIAAATTSDARAAATLASSGEPSALPTPDGPLPATGSTAPDLLRDGSSLDDLAAILASIMIALGLVRSFWREAELRYSPIFLSLAERPG
jgi:hypothetical protein